MVLDALPCDLVQRRLLPLLDQRSLAAIAQSSSRYAELAARLVHTVKLWGTGSLSAALASRHLERFEACQELEVHLSKQQHAQDLQHFLTNVARCWLVLQTLSLRSQLCHLDLLAPLTAAPRSITKLHIHFDVISTPMLLGTLGGMTQLTDLHLQLLGGPHDLTPLGRLVQLQQLHIRAWGDDHCDSWLPSSLQDLTIGSSAHTSDGLSAHRSWVQAVHKCSQLRGLTLLELQASDCPDVLDLDPLTQLTRLDGFLHRCRLRVIGCPPTMRVLQLSDSYICGQGTYEGVPACKLHDMGAALAACTHLEVLHLWWVHGSLPNLPKLHTACLAVGSREPVGVRNVLNSLPSTLTSLELMPRKDCTLELQQLTSCLGLRELCLNARAGRFAVDARDLKRFTALTKLVMCNEFRDYRIQITYATHMRKLPLQEVHVMPDKRTCMQGLVSDGCQVIPL